MRKLLLTCTLAIISITTMATAKEYTFNVGYQMEKTRSHDDLQVISIFEVTNEILEELMEGRMENAVLEFPEGAQIPLSLFLKGELLGLQQEASEPVFIHIHKTFYLRAQEDNFFFSLDMADWKSLLEFVTGNISIGMGSHEGHPVATLGAELNCRSS